MNPNLGASARALQDWLLLGREIGLEAALVLRTDGALRRWLEQNDFPNIVDSMPWLTSWKDWKTLYHALRVAQYGRTFGAQVLHCYEHELYPFAWHVRRFLRIPMICHVHFSFERPFAQWAFARRSRAPQAVVLISEQERQDCSQVLDGIVPRERQWTIYYGLDLTRFGTMSKQRDALRIAWGVKPDEVVVGAANALRARKRVDDFIELIRRLRRRHAGIVGVLAGGQVPGDEDYAQTVEPKLKLLESEGAFRWVGHLEPIEPFMHASDIFVSTSDYETFGMSVCEAMACRRPVVAYRGGSVQEVLGDAGIVVENRDLDALTDAVELLVKDGGLRQQLGSRGFERVAERFHPARSLQQLMDLYESLLREGDKVGQALDSDS